jgi:hypothetical protein
MPKYFVQKVKSLNIIQPKFNTIATFTITENSPKILELNYIVDRDDVIYDICDSDGSIRKSGKLLKNSSTSLNLNDLREGKYMLFIIDQGEVYKKMITI